MQANLVLVQLRRIETNISTYELGMDSRTINSQSMNEAKSHFNNLLAESWEVIAPFWPLESLIAVNPLQGLEELPIEEALIKGKAYFQNHDFPKNMEEVNLETIKWLQAYFDKGQATISMPFKENGLYLSWKKLIIHDKRLHKNQAETIKWLTSLSKEPKKALEECLSLLDIPEEDRKDFLKLMLISLPGWASFIKYKTDWSDQNLLSVTQAGYLAIRVITTYLLWPKAKELVSWGKQALEKAKKDNNLLDQIKHYEKNYRSKLLEKLKKQKVKAKHIIPSAQMVFCIDVRSEPFRRALESTGDYETFGFAGFFGIPTRITDTVTGEGYASCPVLLSPKHEVKQIPRSPKKNGYERFVTIKKVYQSIKYTFSTPLAMVEGLGLTSGLWMGLQTISPNLAIRLKQGLTNLVRRPSPQDPSIDQISFEDQCVYAEKGLKMMGLTERFAPLVVFCGHGSCTQNNAYASSLDCGACGGRHGSTNAKIFAQILNQPEVRKYLLKQGISIPKETKFIGANHNTTTDQVTLFCTEKTSLIKSLEKDLQKAQKINSLLRLEKMDKTKGRFSSIETRSSDWAQVRPEWGLAKNAAFIVGPRDLTRALQLDGRCFLHSYDPNQDVGGESLETILTAPMVVAQWINTQYLFSTLDNVSYGGGSKVTKNITGKIGIMQGNASDLMTGLSLQSVYSSDTDYYHEPQRLLTIVYAKLDVLDKIIQKHKVLKKLFGNGWVQLACIDPQTSDVQLLQRDFTWKEQRI